jgi:hypothetical protein
MNQMTAQELSKELVELSLLMRVLGQKLKSIAPDKGDELIGAGRMAKEWSVDILKGVKP